MPERIIVDLSMYLGIISRYCFWKEKALKKLIYLFLVLTLLVSGFIFHNSLQSPDESNARSDQITGVVESIIDSIFGEDNEIDANYIVRKTAHFIEFFVLGACCAGLCMVIQFYYGKDWMPYSFFCVLLIAVTDEYIQSFTGRTSSVSDVWIDLAGALCGIFSAIVARRVYVSAKEK